MLNRDLKVKLWLIWLTACAAFALLIRHGMRFDFRSAGHAAGTVMMLAPFAVVFHHRNIRPFSNMLIGFLCMVVFNVFLTVLTYAGTPLNAPLADVWLMQADESIGIHLPTIVAWCESHPWLHSTLVRVYYTVLPSTILAIIVLGFDNDVRHLREFVMHYILGGLITTVIYFFVPAEAPFGAYGYPARPDQLRFLEHLHALRAGEFRIVSLNNLEGLITFPSFHTTWAALVAYAFRHNRWLFVPMLLLNGGVIASTVMTGWHYGVDVIGGLLVALLAVFLTRLPGDWLHDDMHRTLAPVGERPI
ncbi:MAG: phosphatase PAP2 family protein [Planctomycetaceae bacterium]|nr:phosphatase PAP2 family protein [Planctomycetaceae bacterium]